MSRIAVVSLVMLCAARVWADQSGIERLTTSEQVVKEIMAADDKAIPGSLFKKAYCAVVIPNMKKAGFVFSAKYGRGFASCRSRSRGVFGGISLQGGTLRPDSDVNKAIYHADQENKDILTGKVKPTSDAAGFLKTLAMYGGERQKK